MAKRIMHLASIALVGILAIVAASCGSAQRPPRVILSDQESRSSSTPYLPQSSVLRVAIAAVISPKETVNSYRALLEYMSARLDRPVELVQGKTYAEINDLVRSGGVTLAFVCTNAYVQGQEDFGMEAIVIPQVKGETVYYSYLIANKDSAVESLDQLKGKTFAFTDPMSNSGRLVPVYVLSQMGETPESFFSKYIFTYSHDNSIKAVADKLVDGAAVDSLVYDFLAGARPSIVDRTRVIWRSEAYGINPVVVHPGLDPRVKAELREFFLGLDASSEGRDILLGLGIDRFVPPDDRAYDSVRAMRAQTSGIRDGRR